MTSTTTVAPLPTDAEIADAIRVLDTAYDKLERLSVRVEQFAYSFEGNGLVPDELPTNSDVGRFFTLAYYLDLRAGEIAECAKEVTAALPLLADMPANVRLRREADEDA